MIWHTHNPTLGRWREKDKEFIVNHCNIVEGQPGLHDALSQNTKRKRKQKKEIEISILTACGNVNMAQWVRALATQV